MIMLFPSSIIQNVIPKMMSEWLIKMGKICAKDKVLPTWPTVVLSEDDPPAFSNRNSPPNRDEHYNNNKYDFEQWLGCYCWKNKQITIWIKGDQAVSEDLKLPYLDLFNCVLIHELGHWFNHLAPVSDGTEWPEDAIESYNEYPRYHEVWAQLFCWLYGHDKDSGVLAAFETLEPRQSPQYKAWRKLVSKEEELRARRYEKDELIDFLGKAKDFGEKLYYILESLPWSRSYGKNACFDEKEDGAMLLNYPPYLRTKVIVSVITEQFPPEINIIGW